MFLLLSLVCFGAPSVQFIAYVTGRFGLVWSKVILWIPCRKGHQGFNNVAVTSFCLHTVVSINDLIFLIWTKRGAFFDICSSSVCTHLVLLST